MSMIQRSNLSNSFMEKCLRVHRGQDLDQISIDSGKSDLDSEYEMYKPGPIPHHLILSNCVRVNATTSNSIENEELKSSYQFDFNVSESYQFEENHQKSNLSQNQGQFLNGISQNQSWESFYNENQTNNYDLNEQQGSNPFRIENQTQFRNEIPQHLTQNVSSDENSYYANNTSTENIISYDEEEELPCCVIL